MLMRRTDTHRVHVTGVARWSGKESAQFQAEQLKEAQEKSEPERDLGSHREPLKPTRSILSFKRKGEMLWKLLFQNSCSPLDISPEGILGMPTNVRGI